LKDSATPRNHDVYSPGLVIKSVCAWCGVVLRNGIEPPTHSICDRCICRLCGITRDELLRCRREFEEEEKRR
jgi:hypothetical protein